MTGVVAATRYLTIVPVPGAADGGPSAVGRAAAWFPVVGGALGAVLVGIDALVGRVFPPLLAALLVVTAWKLLTGGLHLDGLVGRDAADRLRIMRDSRIGAFGAIGLILFLLLELAALAELETPARWLALAIAPTIARGIAPFLARTFPAARPHGQGAAFREAVRPLPAGAALLIGGVAALAALRLLGLVVAAVALLSSVAVGAFLAKRLDGITGDVLGAAIEISELAVLLTVSAWIHVGL